MFDGTDCWDIDIGDGSDIEVDVEDPELEVKATHKGDHGWISRAMFSAVFRTSAGMQYDFKIKVYVKHFLVIKKHNIAVYYNRKCYFKK